jgi:hypothetical protein
LGMFPSLLIGVQEPTVDLIIAMIGGSA